VKVRWNIASKGRFAEEFQENYLPVGFDVVRILMDEYEKKIRSKLF
jgi:hypothetical protein